MPSKYITGLFVHPDTFEIASGLYNGTNGDTFVLDVASRDTIAKGSIDRGQYSAAYAVTAEVTGLPRVHASPGVSRGYVGKGWGTSLYCCAAAAAYLHANDWLDFARGTTGDGAGVSSKSDDPGGRSEDADRWWNRATKAGLVRTQEACGDDEEEEDDFTFTDRKTSGEFDQAVLDELQRIVSEDFSDVRSFTIDGTATRIVEGECFKVDKLLYETIFAKGLVVATAHEDLPLDPDEDSPRLYEWDSQGMEDHLVDIAPSVLRVVNTGYLATKPHGRDALKQLLHMAQRSGVSREDISSMVDRYNDKVDAGGVRYEQAAVAVENSGRPRIRRVRVRGRVILMRENPRRAIAPRKIARGKVVFYGPRPNPAALSKGTVKSLQKLFDRRIELGYGALAGLP